jgi:Spy/CpxP family protein refolding chaperone
MKNRLRALAVILAVLLIGCLLGIGGYHFLGRGLDNQAAVSDARRIQSHTGRLASRLQLTKEQEEQLKAILEDSRRQINTGRAEWESNMQAIRAKTNKKISAILNDEQRRMFQQYLNEAQSHGRPADQGRGHGDH